MATGKIPSRLPRDDLFLFFVSPPTPNIQSHTLPSVANGIHALFISLLDHCRLQACAAETALRRSSHSSSFRRQLADGNQATFQRSRAQRTSVRRRTSVTASTEIFNQFASPKRTGKNGLAPADVGTFVCHAWPRECARRSEDEQLRLLSSILRVCRTAGSCMCAR